MKKKGFTLIELLAVIVILAIIALIATPLVLKYIEKSRKESKVDSAYSFVRNLETEIANFSIKNNGKKYTTDKENIKELGLNITVKGENPDDGKVCISSVGQVEKGVFQYGKYYVSYDGKKGSISDKDTYDNFSCNGNVAKEEVPEATKEITYVHMGHYALIDNNQGIIYLREANSNSNNNSLGQFGTSKVDIYKIPVKKFNETVSLDDNSIEATIRLLDGSEKTIELIKDGNSWIYDTTESLPYLMSSDNGWLLEFRANTDMDMTTERYISSNDYHFFEINRISRNTQPFQSITILGTTLYFNSELFNIFGIVDINSGATDNFYNDQTKLNKIIINYEDGNQDIFNVDINNFDAEGILAIENDNLVLFVYNKQMLYVIHKGVKFNYTDDIFKEMPKLSTITFQEEQVMTTYKISDNPYIMYGGPGE